MSRTRSTNAVSRRDRCDRSSRFRLPRPSVSAGVLHLRVHLGSQLSRAANDDAPSTITASCFSPRAKDLFGRGRGYTNLDRRSISSTKAVSDADAACGQGRFRKACRNGRNAVRLPLNWNFRTEWQGRFSVRSRYGTIQDPPPQRKSCPYYRSPDSIVQFHFQEETSGLCQVGTLQTAQWSVHLIGLGFS